MHKLSLSLPGFPGIKNTPGLDSKFPATGPVLGAILSAILNILFYMAVFLTFYFLVWGAFQYLVAAGNKEELAKARARITWALIGLIVIFLAFFVAKFAGEIFTPGRGGLPF